MDLLLKIITPKKCNELIENINELIEQKIHLFKIDKNSKLQA